MQKRAIGAAREMGLRLAAGVTCCACMLGLLHWGAASAQSSCEIVAQPGLGLEGTNNVVERMLIGPDGTLILGGRFTVAGNAPASAIARFDPDTGAWSALGSGLTGVGSGNSWDGPIVEDIAIAPNGDVIAAGNFSHAGGQPARHIARWNGTEWSALGNSLNALVLKVVVLADGSIVAGGWGGLLGPGTSPLARWDGSVWASIDFPNGEQPEGVSQLAAHPDGSFFVGSTGLTLLRWNAGQWSQVPVPYQMQSGYQTLSGMTVRQNGELVILSSGISVNHPPRGFRRVGDAWVTIGVPARFMREVRAITDGSLLSMEAGVAGVFGGPSKVWRWNGAW